MQSFRIYYFDRRFKNGLHLAKNTNHQIPKINYPVRIHRANICQCIRIKEVTKQLCLKGNENVVFIIERLWDDDIYKNFPKIMCLTSCDYDENFDIMEKDILENLFEEMLFTRKFIIEYFKDYTWSPERSISVRNMVKNMNTICFCRYVLFLDKMHCNSGFAIIGNKKKVKIISHCFNKYIKYSREYDKLCILKLSNIRNINSDMVEYNLNFFVESGVTKIIGSELYMLVGLGMKKYGKPFYSLSFGKREWYLDIIETSLECAKRELYEEFNIQFSMELYQKSCSMGKPTYIYKPGSIIYFLYLDDESTIFYHHKSNTIYLDLRI
ncbi:MAG: hypothetical protein QXW79_00385 [Thermoplasmata archaeon]